MAVLEEPIKEPLELNNFIDGDFVPSKGAYKDVVNPATGKVIAKVPISTLEEHDQAVEAAKEAFPEWRSTPPVARIRCLFRLKELLEEHFEELSRIQTMEHGKTIDESRGETRRGIENVEVATGIPSLMMGYNLENITSGIDEYLIRQPLGVFGIIGPFNFPFMVPLWFAPYAVATGNCIILKPSPEAPISQVKIVELVDEAGIPPGVWNVVHGERDVVSAMLDNQHIKGVCFVGSTPVGKDIVYRRCGETGKRVISQTGAKNFAIVMPDADIPRTIASCMTSFYGNTGQRCLANANLVIVGEGLSEAEHEAFYNEVVDAFVEAASRIKMGYGLDETIHMGPLRDENKKKKVLGYIEKGLQEGARLRLDGRKPTIEGGYPDTCFVGPTVFEDVTLDMVIAQDEIFGPVGMMMKAASLDEAIDMIHTNPFGNSASIFTGSGKWAREFQYRTECGNIGINVGIAAPILSIQRHEGFLLWFASRTGYGMHSILYGKQSRHPKVVLRWKNRL
jgi:malonate-semialdehyde dehydrogenase (acetylating)/methylmalonate-semialdehyde dehydrogenase